MGPALPRRAAEDHSSGVGNALPKLRTLALLRASVPAGALLAHVGRLRPKALDESPSNGEDVRILFHRDMLPNSVCSAH
jgi:hypothetical protein